jgi:ABC-2 type transport system ATP-binding protein
MVPGEEDPEFPALVHTHARVGHNLVTVIDEAAASDGIAWAQQLMARGVAEEYALGATTLEDIYIRLTGHTSTQVEEAA